MKKDAITEAKHGVKRFKGSRLNNETGEYEPVEFVDASDYDAIKRDNEAYIKAFGHIHVRKEDDLNQCAQCGLDLRDPIHFRVMP